MNICVTLRVRVNISKGGVKTVIDFKWGEDFVVDVLQDDKNILNQILYLYTLNYIAVGYDLMLNTIQRKNAKTLFIPVSHKRHPILHPYGQAVGHPL